MFLKTNFYKGIYEIYSSNFTSIFNPLSCSQSIIAHGELAKFHVDRAEAGNCAKAKRIANIFAPTYEDIVENFGSDEKVTVHIPVACTRIKK